MTATVGIIVNPRAGKDVRRLSTAAPARNDALVISDLQRMIVGAAENGAERVLVSADSGGLVERALRGGPSFVELVDTDAIGAGADTTRAAVSLRDEGVDVLLVSGGDGTHRDVALGWRDAPVVARATGTNNAFGQAIEATIAGAAAGLAASEPNLETLVAYRALVIDVDVAGAPQDIALVSAAVRRGDFASSGSVWRAEGISQVFASVAEPWSVGLSALAGVVAPTSRTDDHGVLLDLDDGDPRRVRAVTAPGHVADTGLAAVSSVELDQPVAVRGPAVFVLDGERGPQLRPDEWASMTMRRNGPYVLDVRRIFSTAVRASRFYTDPATVEE